MSKKAKQPSKPSKQVVAIHDHVIKVEGDMGPLSKTSFLYFIQAQTKLNPHFISECMHDICASYQSHLIKYLLKNLIQVSQETNIKHIAIAGGVSANSELRKQLNVIGKNFKWNTYIPKFEYCTDNAAMIAITGYYKYLDNQFCGLDVTPKPRYHI
jgi:N6-L-threonylcarbamoyladenine synthase